MRFFTLFSTLKSSIVPIERWPSGRRRTPGKCVYAKSVSWVRIPPAPPVPYCETGTQPTSRLEIPSFRAILPESSEPGRLASSGTTVSRSVSSLFTRTSARKVRPKILPPFQCYDRKHNAGVFPLCLTNQLEPETRGGRLAAKL